MNFKSLMFYVVAIGFVVALFSSITSYGEANLKASTKIEGRYQIAAQNLPGCLKNDEPLILTIQQSGIYLSGLLLSKNETSQTMTTAKERPSLSGNWDQQKLELSGFLTHLQPCQKNGGQIPMVKIEGTFSKDTLQGKIQLDSSTSAVSFVSKRDSDQ